MRGIDLKGIKDKDSPLQVIQIERRTDLQRKLPREKFPITLQRVSKDNQGLLHSNIRFY